VAILVRRFGIEKNNSSRCSENVSVHLFRQLYLPYLTQILQQLPRDRLLPTTSYSKQVNRFTLHLHQAHSRHWISTRNARTARTYTVDSRSRFSAFGVRRRRVPSSPRPLHRIHRARYLVTLLRPDEVLRSILRPQSHNPPLPQFSTST
jgi:hypothetical protein